MQPSGETHLAEDSPNTAREKMEKESAQRYRSRETELLSILQKRKNRIEESDSHLASSKEHIQPNKSSLNERSPEGDGSRKSSRGNNPSVADIRSHLPSKMAGEQQDVSMHPPSRGSQSASSVQPSASKVRGIIMNSLSASTGNEGPLAIEHHEPKHPLPLTSTHTTSLPEQPPVKQLAQVDTPPSEVSSSSKSLNPPPNPVDPPPKLVDQPPRSPPKLVDPPPRSPPKPVDPPPKHVDTPPIQLSLDSTHHMDCTPVHSTHTDTSVVLPRASEDISSTRELSDTEVSEGEGASVQSPPPVVEDTKKRVTLEENEQSFRKDSQRFPTVSSKMSTSMQYVIQTAVSGQSSSDPSNDDFSESESISLGDHGTEGVDADDGNEQVVGGPTTTDVPSRPHSQISLRGIQMSPMAMQETSQLREALRDTRRKLETVETAKNDLESQRKNAEEELCRVKIANRRLTAEKSELERLKNDLELETRVLKHKLEVETEDKKSLDMTIVELRAKINSVEEEMSSERQSKYSLELRKKELEMKQQTLERTNQQLQLKLAELMEEARTEKEGRKTADQKFSVSAKDLLQIQEKLQVALDEKHKVMSQLENSEVSRQKLADRVALQKEENREIQAQLLKDKKQYDEALDSLERELETANNKLSEKTDLLAVTENNSLDLRRQYEVNLNEVRTKSEMLGAACDREAANRQKLEQEVTGLMTKLEYSHAQLEELTRRNIDLERSGHSSKTDWIYEKSKYEKELEMSKERVETLCARIESLEQNLSSSDAEVKSLQAVSAEKSHTITVLERDLEQRAASLTAAEEKIESLNECVNTTVSSLQSEFSRSKKELEKKLIELREQLGERELEMRELTRERDDLSLKMEGIDKMGGADSIRAHIDSLVDTEKKKQRKMDTLQRQTEAKIEQERQRCAGLQREVASLKGKLKTNKAKLKESEGRLTGVVAMREDYERIQSSMQSDLHAMKEKVAKYEAQLIEGSALRMEAEMQNKALQKEAHHLNKKLTAIAASKTEKEREIQKLERHNRKLTDELHSYKDHVASNYVEKNEALALKQHIEDKVCLLS
jgi:chromosome segregation ATPase